MIAERSKRPSFLFIIFTCTYCCHNWPLNRKRWSFIMAGEINITLRFSAHSCLHWGINNDKRLCEIHKPWRTFSLHKSCWWPISMRPAKTYAWSCILTFFQLVLFTSWVWSLVDRLEYQLRPGLWMGERREHWFQSGRKVVRSYQ